MSIDYSNTQDSREVRALFLKQCEIVETAIENSFGVTAEQLKIKSRLRYIVEARMAMFWLWRKFFEISTTQLGILYERDHSTIIYNIHVAEDLKRFDRFFAKRLLTAQQEVALKIDSLGETQLFCKKNQKNMLK